MDTGRIAGECMDSGMRRRNIFSLKSGSISTDRRCLLSGRTNLKSSLERSFLADMVLGLRLG